MKLPGRQRLGAVPRPGLLGAAAGTLALGAAAGLAAERYVIGRARLAADPFAAEPFFAQPADRVRVVPADDGVPLHVEEIGPVTAPVTVVFCHGYVEQLAAWHFQRQALAEDNPGKLVFWDQRSHGRSGRGASEHATVDQLGRDLLAVLSATAPTGKVVLVGHSMGGMTIMALAQAQPELFGTRVVGVALLSTSTGMLASVSFGLPAVLTALSKRAMPLVTRGMRVRPALFERGRRLSADLAFVATRKGAFGSGDISPTLVEMVERMVAEVPVDVIAEFYDTFVSHDKLAALDVLRAVEVLVLVGSKDIVTPVAHSKVIADALPDAELVVVEGAGHMVQLEQPPLVTRQLRELVRRTGRPAARSA